MNSVPSSQSDQSSIASSALQTDTQFHRAAPVVEGLVAAPQLGPRRSGYGLPCAKCKTYYAADLSACPVCKSEERVSPTASAFVNEVADSPAAPLPDETALEEERERFLREFKAQYASHTQIDPTENFRCSLEEHHPGDSEPSEVCQGCYARLQERVDLLEAALHMDLREATQVVYDAVWSNPSDPSKTYHNAAQAILNEMRKRAGISALLGPLQTLSH